MNFLAHQFLSGEDNGLKLGNFIGDLVKGSKWKDYPIEIQKGILLHRSIDDFTDKHDIVRFSSHLLQPYLTKYAGIATDIFFDHFLAKNWEHYSEIPLKTYVDDIYALVQANIKVLPEKTAYILNYMQSQNWLYNYQFINGIEKTMNGMARRTQQPLLENSHEYLLKHYEAFENNFHAFFPMLQEHTSTFISNLN